MNLTLRSLSLPAVLFVILAVTEPNPCVAEARLASLDAILRAPAATTESNPYTLYRWDRFPSILVLDTMNFHYQDRMFSRLAFFLEKRGFRGRLLGNDELEARHGWNAHDYGASGLADFYDASQREDFSLNPEELLLRDILLEEGVITITRDRFSPGTGGVISISRSSSAIERRLLLTHESFHGIFFASPDYRAFCFQLWDSLDPAEQAFYVHFLEELGYDGESRYLAVNEFQAYLMQQPLRFAPAYFQRVVQRFGVEGSRVPASSILRPARALSSFLESRYGIPAGGTIGMAAAQAAHR